VKQLDRSKPFGTVHGVHQAAFEQDGVLFDAAGNEVGGGSAWTAEVLAGNAQSVIDILPGKTLQELNELHEGETAGKARKTVLAAIDAATVALSDAAGNEVGGGKGGEGEGDEQLDEQLES
jgi:hypothetical protein